jgi:hypothetical protein
MNSTNDDPDEKNEAQEESEAIEQEHERALVNSRLKDQLCLERHRVKGLWRIAIHALFCLIAMHLNAVTALRLHMVEKARSLSLFEK